VAFDNLNKKSVKPEEIRIDIPAPKRKIERFKPERFDYDFEIEHNIETVILESKPVPNPPEPRE